MALKFDIAGDAPTLADIKIEREQAAKDRDALKIRNKWFLVKMITIVLSLLFIALFGLIPTLRDPTTEPTIVAAAAYFTPYLIFPVFAIAHHLHIKNIEKPSKAADTTIDELTEATAEELREITGSEQPYGEITAYLKKVDAQGRSLVRAEIRLIQKWIDKHKVAQ